jgi:hypothetical protein
LFDRPKLTVGCSTSERRRRRMRRRRRRRRRRRKRDAFHSKTSAHFEEDKDNR